MVGKFVRERRYGVTFTYMCSECDGKLRAVGPIGNDRPITAISLRNAGAGRVLVFWVFAGSNLSKAYLSLCFRCQRDFIYILGENG
jgi:hypothetical protein